MNDKKIKRTFWLDEKNYRLLEAYAKKERRSVANLLNIILDDWVKERVKERGLEEKEAPPARRIKKGA